MCAGEKILSSGNVRGRSFAEFWRSDWEIRKFSWDNFEKTCEGCVVNDPKFHCSSRCPALSHARNNRYIGCGASDFEKLTLIMRTALVERSDAGASDGATVEPSVTGSNNVTSTSNPQGMLLG